MEVEMAEPTVEDGLLVKSPNAVTVTEHKPVEKDPGCCQPFLGMRDDLKRRAPFYWSDWRAGFHRKVMAATFFMFFTSIAPAITFSAVMDQSTKENGVSQLGPVEVILSTALTSAGFAIFGGQPLCILGVTGPVTIFTVAVFGISSSLDLAFLPFYCWIQIWTAIMICGLSIFNACSLIKLVTRYSCETFGMLIATIYLYTGTKNIIEVFGAKDQAPALLSLVLALGTCWLSLKLTSARSWSLFTPQVRVMIADYGPTIAVIVFCLFPYIKGFYSMTPEGAQKLSVNGSSYDARTVLATLDVPESFAPTSGRGWLINPADCPVWAIFMAIGPAVILTTLFFFDHNVSSLLCQAPEFGLVKGSAYHWDFFMVGLLILLTGMLGLPPVNGLIPQAPLHTDSLCDKVKKRDKDGREIEVVVGCHENRVSNLMQGVLIGLTLTALQVIGMLPIAALDGLFLFMGFASFGGNTFYERIVLFITYSGDRVQRGLPFLEKVKMGTVHKYTVVQMLILILIFVVSLLPYVAALFPLFIALLVPMRLIAFPSWFGKENVDAMDADVMDSETIARKASADNADGGKE